MSPVCHQKLCDVNLLMAQSTLKGVFNCFLIFPATEQLLRGLKQPYNRTSLPFCSSEAGANQDDERQHNSHNGER